MMKEQTMTSIDAELKKQAKQQGLNLSVELENTLKKRIIEPQLKMPTEEKCFVCNGIYPKATSKSYQETHELKYERDQTFLTWLWPDEKWICDKCLDRTAHMVSVAVK